MLLFLHVGEIEPAQSDLHQRGRRCCQTDPEERGPGLPTDKPAHRQTDKTMPSAWWTGNWGIPHDDRQIIGRRFRFSGMIKCENVTGRARLGVASTNGIGGELFYGQMTHFADGMVRSSGGSIGGTDEAGGLKDILWRISSSCGGRMSSCLKKRLQRSGALLGKA